MRGAPIAPLAAKGLAVVLRPPLRRRRSSHLSRCAACLCLLNCQEKVALRRVSVCASAGAVGALLLLPRPPLAALAASASSARALP